MSIITKDCIPLSLIGYALTRVLKKLYDRNTIYPIFRCINTYFTRKVIKFVKLFNCKIRQHIEESSYMCPFPPTRIAGMKMQPGVNEDKLYRHFS